MEDKNFPLKTTPLSHQEKELKQGIYHKSRLIFWEQGTGKSKLIVDTANQLHFLGLIDRVLVLCPKNVCDTWTDIEVPRHTHKDKMYKTFLHQPGKSNNKSYQSKYKEFLEYDGLKWFCTNYESLMSKSYDYFKSFALSPESKTFLILDEACEVCNPKIKITGIIKELIKKSCYCRLMTGTPVGNSPEDAYNIASLSHKPYLKSLGLPTLTAFRFKYGVSSKIFNPNIKHKYINGVRSPCNGDYVDIIVDYKNIPDFCNKLRAISTRVEKNDVLRLPKKRYINISYNIRDCPKTYFQYTNCLDNNLSPDGQVIDNALTKMLNLSQIITSKYIDLDCEEHRINIVMKAIKNELENHQFIVWCRFKYEINDWMKILTCIGKSFVVYEGETKQDIRMRAIDSFQKGEVKFFIANLNAAAKGITLTSADRVIYYSPHPSYRIRAQSEDRCHRVGQNKEVIYYDLTAHNDGEDTIDKKIIDMVNKKGKYSHLTLNGGNN